MLKIKFYLNIIPLFDNKYNRYMIDIFKKTHMILIINIIDLFGVAK